MVAFAQVGQPLEGADPDVPVAEPDHHRAAGVVDDGGGIAEGLLVESIGERNERGGAENDGYNALTLAAGLLWRDVALLRTISRFMRQIRVPYSQDYMWLTLRKHAALAGKIVELFHTRFDPRNSETMEQRKEREAAVLAEIETGLQKVDSLDEDRIVRHFVNAVQAAVRTNYYQLEKDGQPKPQIAIKFESKKVEALLGDAAIVRHRGKIESTINNARRARELASEFGSRAA